MKFIKLTRILNHHGTTYIPSPYTPIGQMYGITSGLAQQQANINQQMQQSLGQQNRLGQIANYNPNNNTTISNIHNSMSTSNSVDIQEVHIPVDSIRYMIKVENSNFATFLFIMGNEDAFLIKESPEDIMKIMHNTEFNEKMDNILSE